MYIVHVLLTVEKCEVGGILSFCKVCFTTPILRSVLETPHYQHPFEIKNWGGVPEGVGMGCI